MKGPWEQYQSEETGPWSQYQNVAQEEPEEEQPKEATASGEAVKSFKQMGSAYQTALGTFTGDPEAALRAGRERQKEYIKQYGQARGLEEFTKAYGENGILAAGAEALSQVPTAVSGQAANLATMFGAGRLGAMVGAPLGPAGAAVGATIGAISSQIIPFYQQNLEAQLRAQEERGEKPDLNRAKALAYAAVQSSAEIGGTALAFGKNLIGKIIGSKPAAEATETLVKAAKQSLLGAAGKGAVRATGAEIPVEMAQTILQRHQAGESLTDADALEDYKNTIYSTVLVAGPLGAGAGPINRMQARGELSRQELLKNLQQEQEKKAEAETETTQAAPVDDVALEKQIADIEAAGTVPPVVKEEAAPPVTGTTPPAPVVTTTQGDQNATAQTDSTGAGVSITSAGEPGGRPAAGVVGPDGAGVAVAGDTVQQAQAATTEQPAAVEALDFQAWLNKNGIPLTSITSQEQWDALQAEWKQGTERATQASVVEPAPVAETPAPVVQEQQTPAPIKTETETGLDVLAEKKIAKPIKYVGGYTPTTEPSADNFLNQNSTYGKEAPLTVDRGIDMAAADQAFDLFDSAYGKVLNRLRILANAKNKQEGVDGKYSFERPLEFMTANDLINLYKENFGARKTFDEGGKARLDAAKNRAVFVESLTPEQRAKYDAALEKLLKQTVMAEASGRREATESDQRKQKEKQEKQTKKQAKKAVADVQEQVTEAAKTDEQIAAEERAEAEAFAKQQEADKDKSDTADALKSEAQVETEAKKEAVKEAKEEEKKVTKRDKRLMSAVNDSGDIKSVLEEIANDKESSVGMLARNLLKVFKYLNIADPTEKRISFGKVPKGKDGMFSPKTDRITLAGKDGVYTGKRDLAETLMHEIMHHHIDHVVDNREAYLKSLPADARKDVQAALNRLDINYKRAKTELGDKFDISTLKEFIAETFSNRDFQQALIHLDETGKPYKIGVQDNFFKTIIQNIIKALGISPSDLGTTFKQTVEDVMHLVSIPYDAALPAKSVSYSTTPKKAGPVTVDSLYTPNPKHSVGDLGGKSLGTRLADTAAPNNLIRMFQNFRQKVKLWEDKHALAGLIEDADPAKINNVFTQLTLAAGRGVMRYKELISAPMQQLQSDFAELSKKLNLDTDKTLELLSKVTVALHEPERRTVKFLKFAPLRPDLADTRKKIFDILESPNQLSDAQVARLRKKLDSIMFQVDQNGNPVIGPDGYPVVNTNNVTPLGVSPNNLKTVDVGSPDYNVVDMDNASVKNITNEYNNHPQKALIDRLLASVRQIEQGTREMNAVSNYVSTPIDNIIKFYGWKNYVPMKARFEADRAFDPRYRGRELQDAQSSFEGLDTTPDNPILQVMSDAARAASRAGRGDLTLAVKNAVEQGLIKGKINSGRQGPIQFSERNEDLPASKKTNTIFHYNKDGTVDVVEIENPEMLNAIRRTYKDSNPMADLMNAVTGFIGKMHTRYNYTFAPMNFVRDALTNAFTMGADFGPAESARMISKITSKVVAGGGLYKAMKVANMYENGDIKQMKAYAKTDPFVADMVEYLENGGMVSYTESLSLKDKLKELDKELGRSKTMRTYDQFEKFVDVWNNMFEFGSRAAAYGIVKNRMQKQGLNPEQAKIRAAAYVKNLANFEQVGEHGKLMGALFMFFRPAATGAVRAIEAVLPAFQTMNQAINRLPPSILNNPQALANFQKVYAQKQQSARIMVTSLLGLGMMTYYMAAMMSPEDELGRNSVHADNMKQWNRYARFHIPNEISEKLGMGKDVVFQLPWGFGLGAFAAAGAQLAAAEAGRGTLTDALKNISTDIALDSFLPLPISKMEFADSPVNFLIDSITPNVVRPLLQFALNKDGLGRGIYNEPYRRMADAFAGGDRIPEMYKDAARYMFNELGIDVNPNSLYFLSNSYLDGIGRVFENSYGALGLAGEKPANIKNDSLLFGSFFGAKGNVDNREWGEIQSQLMNKQAALNGAKTDPEAYFKYMERNPMDEVLVKSYLKDVNGSLKKLQTEAKQIRSMPGLSPKERQEMLEPNRMMQNLIKSNLVEKYKMYGLNP